jgi:hypothetical protein
MIKKLLFATFLIALGLAFPAAAQVGGGNHQPFQNDVVDPCPTYDSCSMANGYSNNTNPIDGHSYSSCLPWMDCIAKRWDASGNITFSQCEQSGERACAYDQNNPSICAVITDRHPDCGRLN